MKRTNKTPFATYFYLISKSYKIFSSFRALLLLVIAASLFVGISCKEQEKQGSEFFSSVGDAPDNAPPLDTNLSPELNHAAVEKALLKVADWQLDREDGAASHLAFDADRAPMTFDDSPAE